MPEPSANLTAPAAAGLIEAPAAGPGSPPSRQPRLMLPQADRREIAAIFAGGALGTLARAALAEAFPHAATAWPWPTFAVNIAAALLLGSGAVVLGLLTGLALSDTQALLAGTAAVGSYTTWMLETQRLTEERQHRKAILNVVASLALGIAAAALGRLIGAQL